MAPGLLDIFAAACFVLPGWPPSRPIFSSISIPFFDARDTVWLFLLLHDAPHTASSVDESGHLVLSFSLQRVLSVMMECSNFTLSLDSLFFYNLCYRSIVPQQNREVCPRFLRPFLFSSCIRGRRSCIFFRFMVYSEAETKRGSAKGFRML